MVKVVKVVNILFCHDYSKVTITVHVYVSSVLYHEKVARNS
jgi:hypothetical protein